MIAEGSNLPVWFLQSKSGLLRDRFLLSCFTFFILFPEFSFCFFFVSRDDDGAGDEVDDLGGGKIVRAYVPLSEMFGYSTDLRSRTQGRGNYSMFFEKYEPVPKSVQEKVLSNKNA